MNLGSNKMDSNYTGMWVTFFTAAGIPSDVAATYALTFTENRIQNDMLLDLNKEYLRDMGITRMGDVIAILRHAKQVHESTARDRVLSSAVSIKVPVAAVTGRTTSPSSPASRILERYTRNAQVQESPITPPQKRKPVDTGCMEREDTDANVKKARLIRFTAPPQSTVKEGTSNKTVFSRLGNTEAVSTKPATSKASVKPIYARLGSKTEDSVVPIERDALKYEGILKAAPAKKVVTVTTLRNDMRQIALGCTMRADETPVSVRDKLMIPKSKSVKFSNQVQYKEIEAVQKAAKKETAIFNKPERRLSMPEINGVKARLGVKSASTSTITRSASTSAIARTATSPVARGASLPVARSTTLPVARSAKLPVARSASNLTVTKNPNNLTITRNVFNRLGV